MKIFLRYIEMSKMIIKYKSKKCSKNMPGYKGKEYVRNRIVKNKQIYVCKRYNCNFTCGTCWKYSDEIRHETIKFYL